MQRVLYKGCSPGDTSCCGSTGGSAGNGIVPNSGSVSSLDNASTVWGKMDGYHNNVHVSDAFHNNLINLSLSALNSLEIDDNLSANHETEPISTLESPELEHYSTSAEQIKAS